MNLQDLISSISIFLSTLSKEQRKNLLCRVRARELKESLTKILAIIIWFYRLKCKNFKSYFVYFINIYFNFNIKYERFIYWKNNLLNLINLYLLTISFKNKKSNFYILDSTKIDVNKKVKRFNKLYKGYSSTGSFYGFKLHIIIDDNNLITSFDFTSANYSDVNYLKKVLNKYMNKVLLGDKGYNFSNMPDNFIIKPKTNQNKFLSPQQAKVYRKRMNIERFFNVFKNNYNFNPMLCKNLNSLKIMIYSILINQQISNLNKFYNP